MDTREQVMKVLKLSGVKSERAEDLAELIDSLYNTMPRPTRTAVETQLDRVAADSTQYWTDTLGEQATSPLRRRIREILFQFYLGLITNGTWDAIKLFLAAAGTLFLTDQDERVAEAMQDASNKYQDVRAHVPETVSPADIRWLLGEMVDVWVSQKEHLQELLVSDPDIVAFFRAHNTEPDNFGALIAAQDFNRIFDLPSGGSTPA